MGKENPHRSDLAPISVPTRTASARERFLESPPPPTVPTLNQIAKQEEMWKVSKLLVCFDVYVLPYFSASNWCRRFKNNIIISTRYEWLCERSTIQSWTIPPTYRNPLKWQFKRFQRQSGAHEVKKKREEINNRIRSTARVGQKVTKTEASERLCKSWIRKKEINKEKLKLQSRVPLPTAYTWTVITHLPLEIAITVSAGNHFEYVLSLSFSFFLTNGEVIESFTFWMHNELHL